MDLAVRKRNGKTALSLPLDRAKPSVGPFKGGLNDLRSQFNSSWEYHTSITNVIHLFRTKNHEYKRGGMHAGTSSENCSNSSYKSDCQYPSFTILLCHNKRVALHVHTLELQQSPSSTITQYFSFDTNPSNYSTILQRTTHTSIQ